MPRPGDSWYVAGTVDARQADVRRDFSIVLLDRAGEVVLDPDNEPIGTHGSFDVRTDGNDEHMVRVLVVALLPKVESEGLHFWEFRLGEISTRLPFFGLRSKGATAVDERDSQSDES